MIMGTIRKWLVKNFVLGTWVKTPWKTFHTLRAGRILFPLFAFVGMVIAIDPQYPLLQWWDFVLLGMILLGIYFGFNFWGTGYFGKHPAKYYELDDEQKLDFLRAIQSGDLTNQKWKTIIGNNGEIIYKQANGLTFEQKLEFEFLVEKMKEKYKGRFAGLKNLIPLAISIISIIIWYNWIFPFFN